MLNMSQFSKMARGVVRAGSGVGSTSLPNGMARRPNSSTWRPYAGFLTPHRPCRRRVAFQFDTDCRGKLPQMEDFLFGKRVRFGMDQTKSSHPLPRRYRQRRSGVKPDEGRPGNERVVGEARVDARVCDHQDLVAKNRVRAKAHVRNVSMTLRHHSS